MASILFCEGGEKSTCFYFNSMVCYLKNLDADLACRCHIKAKSKITDFMRLPGTLELLQTPSCVCSERNFCAVAIEIQH
jgi:hypothetical protein